jgi:hypothetical protein
MKKDKYIVKIYDPENAPKKYLKAIKKGDEKYVGYIAVLNKEWKEKYGFPTGWDLMQSCNYTKEFPEAIVIVGIDPSTP